MTAKPLVMSYVKITESGRESVCITVMPLTGGMEPGAEERGSVNPFQWQANPIESSRAIQWLKASPVTNYFYLLG